MNIDIKDKTALITGAARGIGLGIAKALDAAGARTIIASLEQQQQLGDTLKHFHTQPRYFCVDLTKPESSDDLCNTLQSSGIQVDLLINNAGIQHLAPVHKFPFDKWQQIIALNLSAAFYLTSLLLPGMQQNRFGRIINISSVHGMVGSVHKSAYVAAKHGLVGLTKVTALENADKGITCNAICPGFVATDLVEAQIRALAKQKNLEIKAASTELLQEKQPSLDFVTAEQLGALVVFLCSTQAAQINGACLPVDGGWLAR